MANLNKEQARAVNHITGPCLVLAGPGSGKTHTLIERIRHMIEDVSISPMEILVITFSKKAALEMQERFYSYTNNKAYNVYFGTFHAVFYNIIKDYYGFESDSVITDKQKRTYIRSVLRKINCSDDDSDYIEKTIARISAYKVCENNDCLKEEFLSTEFEEEKEKDIFLEVYIRYKERCKKEKKLDFDDMMYLCKEALTTNTKLLVKYRSIYKYFLVDEFQDINDIQYEVLNLLAGENNNIFAVGDDDQSIYGFRGSRPELMQRFIDDNEGLLIVHLFKNYRCSELIINYAQGLISNNTDRIAKKQVAAKADKYKGQVIIDSFQNATLEAEYVSNKIAELVKEGVALSDIAVLYRTSRCANLIEEKLNTMGIMCNNKNTQSGYYQSERMLDIIAYLRIGTGDTAYENVFRVINKPERNIDREELSDNNYIDFQNKISIIRDMTPFSAVVYIFKVMEYEKYLQEMGIKNNKKTEQIEEIELEILERAKMYKNITEWLSYIDSITKLNADNFDRPLDLVSNSKYSESTENIEHSKVNLITAHASKGLEFDTVFVIGLQEGIFPHKKALTRLQIEEERRLLYVAMTRAKRNLYVMGRGEEKNGKRISRFVYELQNCII